MSSVLARSNWIVLRCKDNFHLRCNLREIYIPNTCLYKPRLDVKIDRYIADSLSYEERDTPNILDKTHSFVFVTNIYLTVYY
jgi:hypothetical protein